MGTFIAIELVTVLYLVKNIWHWSDSLIQIELLLNRPSQREDSKVLKQPTRQVRQMDWTDRRWRLLVMLSCLVTSVQMERKYIIILKYNSCDSQSQAMIPLQCIMDVTKGPHHLLN